MSKKKNLLPKTKLTKLESSLLYNRVERDDDDERAFAVIAIFCREHDAIEMFLHEKHQIVGGIKTADVINCIKRMADIRCAMLDYAYSVKDLTGKVMWEAEIEYRKMHNTEVLCILDYLR